MIFLGKRFDFFGINGIDRMTWEADVGEGYFVDGYFSKEFFVHHVFFIIL